MFKLSAITLMIVFFCCGQLNAQTALQTSFETTEGYSAGNLHLQNGWKVTSGNAVVSTAKAKSGTQSVNFSANNAALLVDYIAYANNVPGITGTEVYADMYVNPASFVTKGLAIYGYDLYGTGSAKRIFMIEFTTANQIRAYSLSTATVVGAWAANQWVRVSVQINFTAETYKVAIDNVVNAAAFTLRDNPYTPTLTGTRPATTKEFHSLRFNHTGDATLATSDVAVDNVYVGTTPPAGVPFTTASTRTITVNQPDYGSISLNPNTPTFPLNSTVTATLTVPAGYVNSGWTGDLSGTTLVQNITVDDNKTIGANVIVDAANPPPKYKITVTPPANGTITLTPVTSDSMYYKEARVIAKVTPGTCYQFAGWTGDLTGASLSDTFTVQNNMTIGASFTLNSTPSIKRSVATVGDFRNALGLMNPGDTVEVADGIYSMGAVSITRGGCDVRPVLIIAKNKGQATLTDATTLVFKTVNNVTWSGFVFQTTGQASAIKLENCQKVRITANSFALNEAPSCTWITIGDTFGSTDSLKSGNNRIDHNVFDGKTQVGNYVRFDGNIDQQSRYDTVDHNWFKNNGPRTDNGQECIRIGVSTLSRSSGHTLVEYNLFQDCDGDPEIVSVKSCDNTIRYNTFLRSLGTLCLRQGNRSTAEGNYFFGEGKTAVYNTSTIGCGGIRAYSQDHKIINNYFQGLTGSRFDAAITITNGDVDASSTSNAAHFIPENIQIAFNTLVNNKSNIELGYPNGTSYPLAPVNCTFANNIVVDSVSPIIKSYSSTSLAGFTFSNNIMYPTNTASIGIAASGAEINNINPLLVRPNCIGTGCAVTPAYKVFRLSPASPAINAATGSFPFVTTDFERRARTGLKDIGAHEYNSDFTTGTSALGEENVGPNALGFSYAYTYSSVVPVRLADFTAAYANNVTTLKWQAGEEINLDAYIITWSTNGYTFKPIDTVAATGSGSYTAKHINPAAGKNYYQLRMLNRDGSYTFSPVRMITKEEKFTVHVYPNPAKEYINAELSGTVAPGTQINIINSAGAVMKTVKNVKAGVNNIPVTEFAPGVYQLQVVQNGQASSTYAVSVVK